MILKTAASGYDGKGQILVETADQATGAWASLGRSPCVAEGWVDFAAELSVVVARGRRWPGGLLPGRPQPPRAAHPRHDLNAGSGRSDRDPGGARTGPHRGSGAGNRRGA